MRKDRYRDSDKLRLALRILREQAGLSQQELAKTLGRAQSYVSKYERGERRLDVVEVWRICRACRASLTALGATVENARDA